MMFIIAATSFLNCHLIRGNAGWKKNAIPLSLGNQCIKLFLMKNIWWINKTFPHFPAGPLSFQFPPQLLIDSNDIGYYKKISHPNPLLLILLLSFSSTPNVISTFILLLKLRFAALFFGTISLYILKSSFLIISPSYKMIYTVRIFFGWGREKDDCNWRH